MTSMKLFSTSCSLEMEFNSMDHYEKQLYTVFKNFDIENLNSLDKKCLTDLCNTLQLEEKGCQLVDSLILTPNTRVSFVQFRDCLLSILGNEYRSKSPIIECSEEESSEREISPKYVSGSKKYGRKSKPESILVQDFQDDSFGDDDKVQRSSSQCEIVGGKKRKNSIHKLTRCTSVPGNQRYKQFNTNVPDFEDLSIDLNKSITLNDAILLCKELSLDTVDESFITNIFSRHSQSGGQITTAMFFGKLREVMDPSVAAANAVPVDVDNVLPLDRTTESISSELQYPSGETGKDLVAASVIVEMWDLAGLTESQRLLCELGFTKDEVNIHDLLKVLDNAIKIMINSVHEVTEINSPSVLLQASLCLHQFELKAIKNAMEQVFAENNKLKVDLTEANQRAQILAQDVDENHAKIEQSLRNQIKQLEAKHSDTIKDLSKNYSKEREHMTTLVAQLEEKIRQLEIEDVKAKTQLNSVNDRNSSLEKQVTCCQEHISELEEVKLRLTKELKSISCEIIKPEAVNEAHCKNELLAAEVAVLKIQNQNLKDKNDELSIEVEKLHEKLSGSGRRPSLTMKTSCDVNICGTGSTFGDCDEVDHPSLESIADTRGGSAVKRRGDSPSKGENCLFEEESPRIGKVRKCHRKKQELVSNENSHVGQSGDNFICSKVLCNTSESGLDCDLESFSDESVGTEGINKELNKCLPSGFQTDYTCKANCSSKIQDSDKIEIIKLHNLIKEKLKLISCGTNVCECCCSLVKYFNSVVNKYDNIFSKLMLEKAVRFSDANVSDNIEHDCSEVQTENKELNSELDTLRKQIEDQKISHDAEKNRLTNMCKELESNLEQLKLEYERCEEYWSAKLDDERSLFDEEQRISDEKFTDLLNKIAEYEEQFASNVKSPRYNVSLSTIEEKYSLEKQFTDLEEEFDQYKRDTELDIGQYLKEINVLKEKLSQLERTKVDVIQETLSSNSIFSQSKIDDDERAKIEPIDKTSNSSPIEYLWSQSTIQCPVTLKSDSSKKDTRDYQNPAFVNDNIRSHENIQPHSLSDIENDRIASINPIQRPGTPQRCSSTDAIHNMNYGSTNNMFKSIWTDNRSSPNIVHCSELEGELRRHSQSHQVWPPNDTNVTLDTFTQAPQPVGRVASPNCQSAGTTCANSGAATLCLMLEQRCQQLQIALREHRSYIDSIYHTSQMESNVLRSKLHNAEAIITKLQQRLTASDLLVKELYVENCNLLHSNATDPHRHNKLT